MTEAETILKMIETVDPQDTAKLDEIDARVWCYIQNATFLEMGYGGTTFRCSYEGRKIHCGVDQKYTRSRDTLKVIRPDETAPIKLFTDGHVIRFELLKKGKPWAGNHNIAQSAWLPTEELAELHAIIQAIEYERTGQSA
jgi:hypothetical protein